MRKKKWTRSRNLGKCLLITSSSFFSLSVPTCYLYRIDIRWHQSKFLHESETHIEGDNECEPGKRQKVCIKLCIYRCRVLSFLKKWQNIVCIFACTYSHRIWIENLWLVLLNNRHIWAWFFALKLVSIVRK